MNDLNDLERLISAARLAGPSEELDLRVRETLAGSGRSSLRSSEPPSRRNLLLAVAASALIAAGIGFFVGRATAGSGDSSGPSEIALQANDEGTPGAETSDDQRPLAEPHRTTVPLPPERLAGFFVHAGSREGILGVGPVTVEISKTP